MKASRTGTLMFLLASAIAIPLLVIGVQKFNLFNSQASGAVPQFLTVANLTDTTATLVWTTPTGGTVTNVQWGETNQLGTTESDFRDKRDKVSKSRKTHLVQLTGLKPNTTYYYRITSGNVDFPSSSQDPATFQTLSTPTKAAPQALTFYGDVASKVSDAIILLYPQAATGFNSSLPLATTPNTDGTWYVNIANARTSAGEFQSVTPTTPVAIIMHTDSTGYIDLHTNTENPLSLTPTTAITQAKIDQTLLGASLPATPTATPTPTATRRQDVPLRPRGSTPTPTPTPTVTTPPSSEDITKQQLLDSFAAPSVSNISDSSLTVMFVTPTKQESRLLYGTSATSLPSSKYDDADGSSTARYIHHFTLVGLSGNRAYYFRPTSDSTVRTITLPSSISAPSGQTMIVGELRNASGECVIRTQVKRGNTVSSVITTLAGSNYTWTTNIAPVRTSALDSYMIPGPTDTLITNAFCITTTGDVYYQSVNTTVQSGMSSGISLNLVKLQ